MKINVNGEIVEFPDGMSREDIKKSLDRRNLLKIIHKVADVETEGIEDKFIRVKDENAPPEGSTAYGPLQVTLGLASDYRGRKAKLFDEKELKYLDRFIEQGNMFNEFGREPNKKGYNPKYEYGAKGDLGDNQEDKDMYWQVMSKIFEDKLEGDYSPENIAKRWHGGENEEKIKHYANKLRAVGL